MKKVLVLVSKKPADLSNMNWDGLKSFLNKLLKDEAVVYVSALTELVYVVGEKTAIYDPVQNFDIADFDLVVFRTVGSQIENGIAAAHYLKSKRVAFIDSYVLTEGRGKLSCAFARNTEGLPSPQTIYAADHLMANAIRQEKLFGYPFILKADFGKKGRNNFLIKSDAELTEAMGEASGAMIAQEFIPNDGDYRILVLAGKVDIVMLRKGDGSSHLNNTSQGGTAELVDPASLPPQIIADAIKAAKVERLQVAGADVVIDKRSGKYYFLEVNRAPQIATGAFVDEKMQAYANMIKEYLK